MQQKSDGSNTTVPLTKVKAKPEDLLLHIGTGLLIPHFKQNTGCITDTITYGTFLVGIDILNGAVLSPAKASAAWKYFLEVTSHQWPGPKEQKIAKLEDAHAQVSLVPLCRKVVTDRWWQAEDESEAMKEYWDSKARDPKMLKMPPLLGTDPKDNDQNFEIDLSQIRVVGGDMIDSDDGQAWESMDEDESGQQQKHGLFQRSSSFPTSLLLSRRSSRW